MKKVVIIFAIVIATGSVFAQSSKTRVDFGNMQIKGQTKNADTVYMQDRGQLNQESQVKLRENYRKELKQKLFQ